MRARALVAGVALAVTACSVAIPDGRLRCGDDVDCPPGWSCLSDVCRAPGTDVGPTDAGLDDVLLDVPADAASEGGVDAPEDAPPIGPESLVDIDCGNAHSCALTSHGRVFCWGDDRAGQIGEDGVADALPITIPVLVASLPPVEAIALGDDYSCALDEGVAVYCWGTNRAGQLGDVSIAESGSPVPNVVPTLVAPTALAVGGAHACAIVAGGAVRCWGIGTSGELGNDASAVQRTPVAATLPAAARTVTLGLTHTCAVLTDDRVLCWGSNDRRELGQTVTPVAGASSDVPVELMGLPEPIDAIAAMAAHTCVVSDDVVSCWGWNDSGELGGGSAVPSSSAAPIAAMLPDGDVGDIGGGGFTFFGGAHTCAIVDAELRCWGRNFNGELGVGRAGLAEHAPTLVSLADVSSVAGGPAHTCAIAEGLAYCWGGNDRGRLGNGSETATTAPGEAIAIPLRTE